MTILVYYRSLNNNKRFFYKLRKSYINIKFKESYKKLKNISNFKGI